MRRPSPLPTATGATGARDAADAASAEVDAEAVAPPVSYPNPVARTSAPADAPRFSDDIAVPDASVAAQDAPEDQPADEPDGVGVRDVWAAARARRKALRAEVRRFTVRQRRRRMVWLTVIGALVLLVLGSIGAAYSPLFAVEKISVVGTSSLNPADVEKALAGQLGTPLPRVDPSAVKAALVAFPLVESYTLEARPPHELVVRIVERTPIGSVESPAGYTLVDAAGVALSTTPTAPAGHPVITATGGIGSPAFDAIGTVFRSLPDDIRAQVTAMSATTANDVTLTLGGTGTSVVWGNADESAKKAEVLASAMAARPPEHVYTYDVSSPGAVVIR